MFITAYIRARNLIEDRGRFDDGEVGSWLILAALLAAAAVAVGAEIVAWITEKAADVTSN